MSDHWETFPCAMGDHEAWISFDHGVREQIDALPFGNVAKFKVLLQAADGSGLPQGDELARLGDIQAKLAERIEAVGGRLVGRINTNGACYFFFYTAANEEQCDSIAQITAAESGYELLLAHEPDPKRQTYWGELYPTEADWQVIRDLRVEKALRDKGDSLNQPRPIEHWVYFKSAADRRSFVSLVGSRFESVQEFDSPQSRTHSFGVRLTHTGRPDYRSMNDFTISLACQAKECEGEYDGWETKVCKG
jgi:hypothetical protein